MRVRESADGQEEWTRDHTQFVPKYSNETKGGNKDPTDNENNPLNEDNKAANEYITEDSNVDTHPENKKKVNEEPHIVTSRKFLRISSSPHQTLPNVKFDATEEVGGGRKLFHSPLKKWGQKRIVDVRALTLCS